MKRLFDFLSPFKARFYFSISSAIANKILDLMPPLLVGWVIDSVSGNPPQWIATITGTSEPWNLAVFLCTAAILIFGFESLFQWMYQYGFMTLAQKLQHHLRLAAYKRLQTREMAFFENHRLGNTLSILNDDVNQLERFLNTAFVEIVHLIILILFSGYVLFSTSWQLALIGLAPVPFVIIGSLIYQRFISPRYKKVREAVGALSSRLENNLSGILVIKSFTAENFEYDRVKESSETYLNANIHAIKLNTIYVPVIRMAVACGFGGVLLVGSYWILNGAPFLTVGELVLFSMLIQRVLWPLTRLGAVIDEYERASVSTKRVFDLVDTPSDIQSPENPSHPDSLKGEVSFNNVHFHYHNQIPILKGLNFTVKPGETLGIAGTTGAGKSTLVKLLWRLYDVTDGAVTIDAHNVKAFELKALRHHMSLVSQDVYLFHGSIFDNIAYGEPNITLEDVIKASKLAEFHDFVHTLPEGYHSIVGERGIKLSGGQRQRLSIARAILRNAPIMVFDEATSSVDTETERAIQKNINRLTKGKTALVIAHRLSTIRHADRIIVIDNGQVLEEGHHDDLLEKTGLYADLWNIQTGQA